MGTVHGEIRIRRAAVADAAVVLAFHRALYIDHRRQMVPAAIEELGAYADLDEVLRDDVRGLLGDTQARVLLACDDNKAVGYITAQTQLEARRLLPRRGIIEDWWVEETVRCRGVGTQLLLAMLTELRALGCQVVDSTTWPGNEASRTLHRRLGFHEVELKYRMRL